MYLYRVVCWHWVIYLVICYITSPFYIRVCTQLLIMIRFSSSFFLFTSLNLTSLLIIDHFWVVLNLIIKARLRAKFLFWKLVFIHMQNKINFLIKSFALSLAFIVRFTATRKWPIASLAAAAIFSSFMWAVHRSSHPLVGDKYSTKCVT